MGSQQSFELYWLSYAEDRGGQLKKAIEYNKAYQATKEQLNAKDRIRKIATVEQQFQIDQQEERIAQLEQKSQLELANSRKNKLVAGGLAALLFLVIIVFVLAYRQRRLKLKKEIAEMKQKLLRIQMNPHFVFNSLNSIQNQLLKGNTESSVLLMGKFSRLMRKVLNHSTETFVSIHEELELLRLYLDLEQVRTNQKFNYEIRIDDAVDIHNVQMPSMITQVFVENAIWHGIAPKPDKGNILLEIKQRKDMTVFSIVDDGIGRKYSLQSKTHSQRNHKSLGTQLVKERIQQINRQFSKKFELMIEDISGSKAGTEVNIILN